MEPYFLDSELCPKCGCVMGDDAINPLVRFVKCEECGEYEYVSTIGDRMDEAKNLFDWRD